MKKKNKIILNEFEFSSTILLLCFQNILHFFNVSNIKINRF